MLPASSFYKKSAFNENTKYEKRKKPTRQDPLWVPLIGKQSNNTVTDKDPYNLETELLRDSTDRVTGVEY